MHYRNAFIIRIGLMAGVFMFAAISYFGPRFGMGAAIEVGEIANSLRYALWGLIALAVTGAALIRPRLEVAAPERQGQYLIIGWALGEAAAIFGVVLFRVGGGIGPLSLGLMTFVFTLVLLPIPRARS